MKRKLLSLMLALAMLLSLNMTVLAADGEGYGGTLPFEVATTGVKGLATIIPYAGIASWYDYTNSQGVPIVQDSNYMDCLAAFNCGGTFLDRDWTVSNKEYGSWKAYDNWKDFQYTIAPVGYSRSRTVVTSRGLADYAMPTFANGAISGGKCCEDYYLNLPERNGAVYDLKLKSGTTVYGTPEVHVRLSSEVMDYEGLMITAVLMDVADDGSEFDAFMLKDRLGRTLPVRAIGEFEGIGCRGNTEIFEYVQDSTPGKAVSYGWTDLTNPGGGTDLKDYAETAHITAGEFYDYTFYMLPTVYTVAPGHHLELILTAWDPYRAFLDLSAEQLGFVPENDIIDYDYSYIIDNDSLQVRLPVAGK